MGGNQIGPDGIRALASVVRDLGRAFCSTKAETLSIRATEPFDSKNNLKDLNLACS